MGYAEAERMYVGAAHLFHRRVAGDHYNRATLQGGPQACQRLG